MTEYVIYHMKRVEFESRGQPMVAMTPLPMGYVKAPTPEAALVSAKRLRPYLGSHIAVGVRYWGV